MKFQYRNSHINFEFEVRENYMYTWSEEAQPKLGLYGGASYKHNTAFQRSASNLWWRQADSREVGEKPKPLSRPRRIKILP